VHYPETVAIRSGCPLNRSQQYILLSTCYDFAIHVEKSSLYAVSLLAWSYTIPSLTFILWSSIYVNRLKNGQFIIHINSIAECRKESLCFPEKSYFPILFGKHHRQLFSFLLSDKMLITDSHRLPETLMPREANFFLWGSTPGIVLKTISANGLSMTPPRK
jgi:hypothetical protein